MTGVQTCALPIYDDLRHGKFDVIAEMVASPLVEQLRQEEYARYGILRPQGQGAMGRAAAPAGYQAGYQPAPAPAPAPKPQTMNFNQMADDYDFVPEDTEGRQAYIYDITNDRAFTLPGDAETIGRESKNDIVIPDINVSRVHAEIRQDESGAWILTDLGSTNGTFVNGRQIKSTALQDADRIIVGTTNLEFQLI